jgi:type IV secretion system protein VirB1
MTIIDFATCAPNVHPVTMAAVARVESGFNPLAIGVIGGRLVRQPVTKAEATATAEALEKAGYNFDVGIGQVNRHNLAKYSLSYEAAFDACSNLRVAALILNDCFTRAKAQYPSDQRALDAALSCYCSGNFQIGLRAAIAGQLSYVGKVVGSVRPAAEAPLSKHQGPVPATAPAADPSAIQVDSVMVYR